MAVYCVRRTCGFRRHTRRATAVSGRLQRGRSTPTVRAQIAPRRRGDAGVGASSVNKSVHTGRMPLWMRRGLARSALSAVHSSARHRPQSPPWFSGVTRAQREHELALNLRARRDELLKEWHEGLADSHSAYQKWLVHLNRPGADQSEFMNPDIPDAAGTAWFGKLRPYISETGDAAEYRYASSLHCDQGTVVVLSMEIGRIEQEWLAEVKD
jgi:hypothetical protein